MDIIFEKRSVVYVYLLVADVIVLTVEIVAK